MTTTYLTYDNFLRIEEDQENIDNLLRKGWIENPPPQFDPSTQSEPEWVDGVWVVRDLTPEEIAARNRKVWINSATFLQEFSMPELAQISLSLDPTVAALRLLLTAWNGEVWSDDPRIVLGLDSLVTTSIITEERKTEILTV